MRPLNRTALSAIILCGALLIITSCKKQIAGPLEPAGQNTASQSLATSSTSCRPAIFATMYNGNWTTIAQKWYSDGKIRYFKGHFSSPAGAQFMFNTMQDIEWGQVTYEGNQVQLRDGSNNIVFRATLDEFNKPVATYMYAQTTVGPYVDTSYYYYTGDRLDYIITLSSQGWDKLTFSYGGNGNLASYYRRSNEVTTEFRYYSTPANGMVAPYSITPAYRMLDLLELIKVPMHNTLYETVSWLVHFPTGLHFFNRMNFYVYNLNSDGLVQSYLTPGGPTYFYTGWDCDGSSSAATAQKPDNVVTSLDQFKKWSAGKKGN